MTGMDRTQYVKTRVGRYMAQTLEEYERLIEPRVPKEVSDEFKSIVRRKISALGADCIELLGLENEAMNGFAREMKDRVDPDAARATAAARR